MYTPGLTNSGLVKEALTALVKLNSMTGANPCDVIVQCLTTLQLNKNFLIGQCYSMVLAIWQGNIYSGVQAKLKELCTREP